MHKNVSRLCCQVSEPLSNLRETHWPSGFSIENEGLPKHEFHGTMRKIANIHPNDSGPLLANGSSRDKDQNHVSFKYNQQDLKYIPSHILIQNIPIS